MASPNVLAPGISGLPLSANDYNNNLALIESTFLTLGSWIVSGLVPSAGTGLSVNVTAGSAVIGAEVTAAASFTIAGLTNATTNYLYLRQDGTGTSNTTGTQPANTAFLGTAVTAGGVVTSVSIAGRPATVPFRDTNGHLLLSGGSAPAAAAGAQAGTSPPSPVVASGSNDTRGRITFGTGTSPAAGELVAVTFAQPYASAPFVVVSPTNDTTSALAPSVASVTTTGFSLFLATGPAGGAGNTVYGFAYVVLG